MTRVSLINVSATLQLRLRLPKPQPKPTHGGARKGAGRKRTLPGPPRLPHHARPRMDERIPFHITRRIRRDVGRLRGWHFFKVLRSAFVNGCLKQVDDAGAIEFRICQFSIQGNHVHLIGEATSNVALARGMTAWSMRMSRGINRQLERTGGVFDDRYHIELLRSPTQTRNALCYVLQNARRHRERPDPRFNGMDPFSSAWWFDGWDDDSWREGIPPPDVKPVAEARSWMLREGWKRAKRGLLAIHEVPGPR